MDTSTDQEQLGRAAAASPDCRRTTSTSPGAAEPPGCCCRDRSYPVAAARDRGWRGPRNNRSYLTIDRGGVPLSPPSHPFFGGAPATLRSRGWAQYKVYILAAHEHWRQYVVYQFSVPPPATPQKEQYVRTLWREETRISCICVLRPGPRLLRLAKPSQTQVGNSACPFAFSIDFGIDFGNFGILVLGILVFRHIWHRSWRKTRRGLFHLADYRCAAAGSH